MSPKKANVSNAQQRNRSEARLRRLAFLERDAVFDELVSDPRGLSAEQAEERLEQHGPNRIQIDARSSSLLRLREAVINPFNIVLLVIAVITFFTDIVIAPHPDYATVVSILLLVLLSSLVSFFQSERSNAAAEKLSQMISNKVDVWRDGAMLEIVLEDVVPGDIIRLSAGDMIPADVRFLSAKDAFIAQSALTGESNPVEKFAEIRNAADDALTDLSNIGFMGSNMVSGSATALALSTGNETYFGSMAKTLSGDRAKNSFERGVDAVSSLLIRLMLVLVPIVFLINGLTKQNWIEALLFAVSIAVGLTPEMLPVIMTSTLAKGAVRMSGHKVIVKTLGAIQTFGEMDVLCTDKTGTLTEDRIVLERYMNVRGEEDPRILRHSFLNSFFQTGLKNLIDLAIIDRATQNGLTELLSHYTRVDEIPFDFTRRRMSVVLVDQSGKRQLITKGAVEEMLAVCSFIDSEGQILPLDDTTRSEALATYERYNTEGLRILAVAQKNNVADIETFGIADERDMVLLGFVGFLDPPKASAKTAINALLSHGVRVVVLTGDSEGVAAMVCGQVGVDVSHSLSGKDVEAMDDATLRRAVRDCNLFAKLSPSQKQRVVQTLQAEGHTVGYMGDGINDAPPLHQADVGISVDSAVDIAKETADIILLEKDLMVLEEGVVSGRETFGNIVKYIKMAASGNFGNMISVVVASIFLPFLPMLPVQILTQNLLNDFAQLGMPFDHVDAEYLLKPRRWETGSIKQFMAVLGPLSSLFDILCYAVMWWIIGAQTAEMAPLFQCGWFVFGTISQILIIHMIRTARIPFIQSIASAPLIASTALIGLAALVIGFSSLAWGFDMMPLPLTFVPWLLLLLLGYSLATQTIKAAFIRRFGEWL